MFKNFRHPKSLKDRLSNSFVAFMVYIARYIFILPYLEDLITNKFPLDDIRAKPSLTDLEQKAGKIILTYFFLSDTTSIFGLCFSHVKTV